GIERKCCRTAPRPAPGRKASGQGRVTGAGSLAGLTAGSLCTGYGGLDIAAPAVLGTPLPWMGPGDPHAPAVLAGQWPDVPTLGDITTLDWAAVPPVDLVTAGWPCQDISYAGPG